jgi:hypothetical protein
LVTPLHKACKSLEPADDNTEAPCEEGADPTFQGLSFGLASPEIVDFLAG